MSTKTKKKLKNQRTSVPSGEQALPQKTIVAMVLSGLLMTIWLVAVPTDWWLSQNSELIEAKFRLLTLVASSMALATLLLTTTGSENPYKTLAYAMTGIVVWAAAFAPPYPDSFLSLDKLKVGGFMLVASTPLFIAILVPRLSKITTETFPFYALVAGLILVAFSLFLSGTKFGMALAVIVGVTGYSVFVLTLFVFGILIIFAVLSYGAAKLRGNNTAPWR